MSNQRDKSLRRGGDLGVLLQNGKRSLPNNSPTKLKASPNHYFNNFSLFKLRPSGEIQLVTVYT